MSIINMVENMDGNSTEVLQQWGLWEPTEVPQPSGVHQDLKQIIATRPVSPIEPAQPRRRRTARRQPQDPRQSRGRRQYVVKEGIPSLQEGLRIGRYRRIGNETYHDSTGEQTLNVREIPGGAVYAPVRVSRYANGPQSAWGHYYEAPPVLLQGGAVQQQLPLPQLGGFDAALLGHQSLGPAQQVNYLGAAGFTSSAPPQDHLLGFTGGLLPQQPLPQLDDAGVLFLGQPDFTRGPQFNHLGGAEVNYPTPPQEHVTGFAGGFVPQQLLPNGNIAVSAEEAQRLIDNVDISNVDFTNVDFSNVDLTNEDLNLNLNPYFEIPVTQHSNDMMNVLPQADLVDDHDSDLEALLNTPLEPVAVQPLEVAQTEDSELFVQEDIVSSEIQPINDGWVFDEDFDIDTVDWNTL